ncbi:TPA: hypothetical protein DEP21_03965 [Patescibacteria group bacterium]|nr:hypothetical protein [Candidatus Gracilibacteria bacterium]
MNKLLDLFTREKLAKIEEGATLFIYYILPVIVLLTIIPAMVRTDNIGFLRQESRGNNGWTLLAIILFIKPIILLTRKYLNAQLITMHDVILTIKDLPKTLKTTKIDGQTIKTKTIPFLINCLYSISAYLMRFRRQLGVATFWSLFTHFLLWQIFRVRQGLGMFFDIQLAGTIGLIAIAIGALTSNNYSMKKLQANRKKVQMVAYVAFFFGAIHTGNVFRLIVYAILKYIELRDL